MKRTRDSLNQIQRLEYCENTCNVVINDPMHLYREGVKNKSYGHVMTFLTPPPSRVRQKPVLLRTPTKKLFLNDFSINRLRMV